MQITGKDALGKTPARYLVRKREALDDQIGLSHLWMVLLLHSWELRANLKMEESLEDEIY